MHSVEERASDYYAQTLVWEIDVLVSFEGDEKTAYVNRNERWYASSLHTGQQQLEAVRAEREATADLEVPLSESRREAVYAALIGGYGWASRSVDTTGVTIPEGDVHLGSITLPPGSAARLMEDALAFLPPEERASFKENVATQEAYFASRAAELRPLIVAKHDEIRQVVNSGELSASPSMSSATRSEQIGLLARLEGREGALKLLWRTGVLERPQLPADTRTEAQKAEGARFFADLERGLQKPKGFVRTLIERRGQSFGRPMNGDPAETSRAGRLRRLLPEKSKELKRR